MASFTLDIILGTLIINISNLKIQMYQVQNISSLFPFIVYPDVDSEALFSSLCFAMSGLIKWNDKCDILKEDSLPIRLELFMFSSCLISGNFSPGHRKWEDTKWQHLSISEQTSNETYKEIWRAVQLTQNSMGAWHWTEKVSTQLERVVWEELLIASYSLREWHRDYPFLQHKATKGRRFPFPYNIWLNKLHNRVSGG